MKWGFPSPKVSPLTETTVFSFRFFREKKHFAFLVGFLQFQGRFENFLENMFDGGVFERALIQGKQAVEHDPFPFRVKTVDALGMFELADLLDQSSPLADQV